MPFDQSMKWILPSSQEDVEPEPGKLEEWLRHIFLIKKRKKRLSQEEWDQLLEEKRRDKILQTSSSKED